MRKPWRNRTSSSSPSCNASGSPADHAMLHLQLTPFDDRLPDLLIVLAGQVCQCWAMSTTAFGRERKMTLPADVFGAAGLKIMNPLDAIEGHLAELRALGARRIGVFGSCARGQERADSDVDAVGFLPPLSCCATLCAKPSFSRRRRRPRTGRAFWRTKSFSALSSAAWKMGVEPASVFICCFRAAPRLVSRPARPVRPQWSACPWAGSRPFCW